MSKVMEQLNDQQEEGDKAEMVDTKVARIHCTSSPHAAQ